MMFTMFTHIQTHAYTYLHAYAHKSTMFFILQVKKLNTVFAVMHCIRCALKHPMNLCFMLILMLTLSNIHTTKCHEETNNSNNNKNNNTHITFHELTIHCCSVCNRYTHFSQQLNLYDKHIYVLHQHGIYVIFIIHQQGTWCCPGITVEANYQV